MTTISWTTSVPTGNPFAFPSGMAGRLAGRVMLWTNRQQDLLELLDVQSGDRVLEVGYGPGGLVRLLQRTPAATIFGVDPSPEMRSLARRLLRKEVAAGRIDLRLGTADRTGFTDGEFDRVVTANTVGFWPDLAAGIRELHRVTRRGGRAVIAWHGGTGSSRLARRLALPEQDLAKIEHGLAARFTSVTRDELSDLTVFSAVR